MYLNLGSIKLAAGQDIQLPNMVPVKQRFESKKVDSDDIPLIMQREFLREDVKSKIKPGMKIAIGVGSRGIDQLAGIVAGVIRELKRLRAEPFIVPAMGSHGGGTAEGQAQVLAEYGITEQQLGVPVRASMETVHLGTVMGDVQVYFDKTAYTEADGIIVVSRIKPHTDFKAKIESGIMKMLGIGLGKHKGASYLHRGGMGNFGELLPAVGRLIMEKTPFLFGVGIVEDAFHHTAHIELITKEQLPAREEALLDVAKRFMPRFWFDEIDVLIIDEIGKNISGSGLDPNIVGRTANTKFAGRFGEGPPIHKVVILGLTKETNGNAVGIGLADYSTRRLVEQIDFSAVYTNAITAIEIGAAKLPLILQNDREAISVGLYTGGRRDLKQVKMVRIKNTLCLDEILVSENMVSEVERHPMMDVIGRPVEWKFDTEGYVV